MQRGFSNTNRKNNRLKSAAIVALSFLSVLANAANAFPKSQILSKQGITFVPAIKSGDQILVPINKLPKKYDEVVLLHSYKDLFSLKQAKKESVTPQEMASPTPHLAFMLSEGKLSDSRSSFLVAVGKNIKKILKWGSRGTMNHGDFPFECMSADKGFAVTSLDVLFSKSLDAKLYYLRQGILQTTFDKMNSEERSSGVWLKETIGLAAKDGKCKVLAWNTSDGDGQNNKSKSEPLGNIYGVIEAFDGKTVEKWLVLDAVGYEVSGYTFIELLPPFEKEAKQFFLEQDGS